MSFALALVYFGWCSVGKFGHPFLKVLQGPTHGATAFLARDGFGRARDEVLRDDGL